MTEEQEKRFERAMDKIFQPKLSSPTTSSHGTPSPKKSANSGNKANSGQSKGPSSSGVGSRPPRLSGSNLKFKLSSVNSSAPVCRPWDRGDLLRRLATFKSMTWFGKPKVVGPVNCARKGWVNVNADLIACEACGSRLSFSTPPTWTKQQVEDAAELFSTKLDDGHKSLCPWKGNECEEALVHFPPTPTPALVESFRDRCDALFQSPALPIVSTSAIQQMKISWAPQVDCLLAQPPPLPTSLISRNSGNSPGIEIAGGDDAALTTANLYYQSQRLISLCGWEPRLLPYIVDCEDRTAEPTKDTCPGESSPRISRVHSPGILLCSRFAANEVVESSQNKSAGLQRMPDTASMVLDCVLCGASVGMWTFSTVYRPAQLTYDSVVGQENSKNQNESCMRGLSAASYIGGVSASGGKSKENLDDVGEALTSTCKRNASDERILDLSLTIAGGLPPTKQNVGSSFHVPSVNKQVQSGLFSSSEVVDKVISIESYKPQDKIQSTGQYNNSSNRRKASTDVDQEGTDATRSSKRKITEDSCEVSRRTSLGHRRASERFNDTDDDSIIKRRFVKKHDGMEHFSSVNAVDTCYHSRKENSTESVDNVPQGSCKSDGGIEEGTGTNLATMSTSRIGGISVGMSVSGTQADAHGEVCGNDISVNRAESRADGSEVHAETTRSAQQGEVVSMGDKAGCASICEDSQHAILVDRGALDFTSSKDSIANEVSMEFLIGGERSEVYEPAEISEKQEKSDTIMTEPHNYALETDVTIRPTQETTAKSDNVVISASESDLEQRQQEKGMEFDPIKQHRHFCPWVTGHVVSGLSGSEKNTGLCGWQLTLDALDHCNAQELANASLKESESTSSRYKVNPVASVRLLFEIPSAKKSKGSRVYSSNEN